MAKRKITITLTVKQAAALCDAVSYGECDMEGMLLDDEPMITNRWLELAGEGSSILRNALRKADPDWLDKSQNWQNEWDDQQHQNAAPLSRTERVTRQAQWDDQQQMYAADMGR